MSPVYVRLSRIPQLIMRGNRKGKKTSKNALKCTARIRVAKVKGAEKLQKCLMSNCRLSSLQPKAVEGNR
jgi:hypothetical protein